MAYWRFPKYVTVAEKRAKAEKKIKQLLKKNPHIKPVVVEGRSIARTWWGKAWNDNLERYADFANRIERGRSYVRHRAVLDLKIAPGKVTALVQGSAARPYTVDINIKVLGKKAWQDMKFACSGKFDSLQDLLAGRFPKAMAEVFTAQGKGLFPAPREVTFDCSCPDWADMCKHVAAALYGIGARLDEDPSLFFKLRKVKVDDLVAQAVTETAGRMLEQAAGKKEGVIADADLGDLFGIEMEEPPVFGQPKGSSPKLPGSKTRKQKKTTAAGKRKKAPADDKALILDMVKRSRTGVDVPSLVAKTGLDTVKVRNTIYYAFKKGVIEKTGRGIYKAKAQKADSAAEFENVLSLIKKTPDGIGVPAIRAQTDISESRIRYVVQRACAKGEIYRRARGIYAAKRKTAPPATVLDGVMKIINRHRKGITFSLLREKSGLEEIKLRNSVFRLTSQGKIKRIARGVYGAVKKQKKKPGRK